MACTCKLDHELGTFSHTRFNNVARSYESMEHDSIRIGAARSAKLVRDCKTTIIWQQVLD